MIINKKNLFFDAVIALCAFTLYGVGFELYLTFFLFIATLIRMVHRKFYLYTYKSEWMLLALRIIIVFYFYNRGFLGQHQILFLSSYILKITLILTILDSFYYIFKTYQAIKLKDSKIDVTSNLVINNDLMTLERDFEQKIDTSHLNFDKRRIHKHKTENISLTNEPIQIKKIAGMNVKVLTPEQKQNLLKQIKQK